MHQDIVTFDNTPYIKHNSSFSQIGFTVAGDTVASSKMNLLYGTPPDTHDYPSDTDSSTFTPLPFPFPFSQTMFNAYSIKAPPIPP